MARKKKSCGSTPKKQSRYAKWITEEGLIKLTGWARNGLIDEQIARNMGVSVATLYRYKRDFPEIDEALKKGKEVVDLEVENALLRKALGFKETVSEPVKVKTVDYENGRKVQEREEVVFVEKEMYVPPDTGAICFWLKNRKPESWRDKKEVDATVNHRLEDLMIED